MDREKRKNLCELILCNYCFTMNVKLEQNSCRCLPGERRKTTGLCSHCAPVVLRHHACRGKHVEVTFDLATFGELRLERLGVISTTDPASSMKVYTSMSPSVYSCAFRLRMDELSRPSMYIVETWVMNAVLGDMCTITFSVMSL